MIGQGSAGYQKSHSFGGGMMGILGTFPPAVISSAFLDLINTFPQTNDGPPVMSSLGSFMRQSKSFILIIYKIGHSVLKWHNPGLKILGFFVNSTVDVDLLDL